MINKNPVISTEIFFENPVCAAIMKNTYDANLEMVGDTPVSFFVGRLSVDDVKDLIIFFKDNGVFSFQDKDTRNTNLFFNVGKHECVLVILPPSRFTPEEQTVTMSIQLEIPRFPHKTIFADGQEALYFWVEREQMDGSVLQYYTAHHPASPIPTGDVVREVTFEEYQNNAKV